MVFWDNPYSPAQYPMPMMWKTLREQSASHQAWTVCTAVLQRLLQPCGWDTVTGSSADVSASASLPQFFVIFLLQQSPLSVLPPSPCHVCQVFSALIRYQRISFTNHWHSLMSEIKQGSCSVMCNSRKYMYINFRIGNEQNDVYLKRVMCFPWQKVINKKIIILESTSKTDA